MMCTARIPFMTKSTIPFLIKNHFCKWAASFKLMHFVIIANVFVTDNFFDWNYIILYSFSSLLSAGQCWRQIELSHHAETLFGLFLMSTNSFVPISLSSSFWPAVFLFAVCIDLNENGKVALSSWQNQAHQIMYYFPTSFSLPWYTLSVTTSRSLVEFKNIALLSRIPVFFVFAHTEWIRGERFYHLTLFMVLFSENSFQVIVM